MIRVELDPVFDDWSEYKKSPYYVEMKQWCKDNFGKNPMKGPKIWCTNYRYVFVISDRFDEWAYLPAFFFADPKHAQWFRLRWS